MKKIILLYAMILTIGHSYSQTNIYHPFPDTNAIWVGERQTFDGLECYIYDKYNMFIDGDSTIGSYTYHKLYQNGFKYSNCPPPGFYYFKQLKGFFRQDIPNKKVYINHNGMDTLAYDFNLHAGDTLPPSFLNGTTYYVESVDSILVGNSYRKMFWLSNYNATYYLRLIEGIGSDHGLLAPMLENWSEHSNLLYCIYEDGDVLWKYYSNGYGCNLITSIEDKLEYSKVSVQPNPFRTKTLITIPGNYSDLELTIYNSYGQKVKKCSLKNGSYILFREELPNGLYIIQITAQNQLVSTEKVIITD